MHLCLTSATVVLYVAVCNQLTFLRQVGSQNAVWPTRSSSGSGSSAQAQPLACQQTGIPGSLGVQIPSSSTGGSGPLPLEAPSTLLGGPLLPGDGPANQPPAPPPGPGTPTDGQPLGLPAPSPSDGAGSPPTHHGQPPTPSSSAVLGSSRASTLNQTGQVNSKPPVNHGCKFKLGPPPTRPSINLLLNSLRRNCSPNSVNYTQDSIRRTLYELRLKSFLLSNYMDNSCENRCGLSQRNSSVRCYCDTLCYEFGDCCFDFDTLCRDEVQHQLTTRLSNETCWAFYMGTAEKDGGTHSGFAAIGTCSSNWREETLRRKCHNQDPSDLLNRLPVFDKINHKTYRNIFCAKCNGVKNVTYWKLKVSCSEMFNVSKYSLSNMNFHQRNCSAEIFANEYQRRSLKRCIPRLQDCSDVAKEMNETQCQKECLRYAFPVCYMYNGMITHFRNIQCAICHGLASRTPFAKCTAELGPGSLPSLTILFDFQSTSKYQMKVQDSQGTVIRRIDQRISCQADEVYDPYLTECRPLVSSIFVVTWHEDTNTATNKPGKSTLDRTHNCSFISFNESQYVVFSNKSVYVKPHGKIYNKTEYKTRDNELLLCVNFSRRASVTKKVKHVRAATTTLKSLELLTTIGGLVSTISLILLLLTYILFPELRNLPGKIVINLASSLLMYQLFFFLAAADTSNKVRCLVVAVFLHFFTLSSFAWMNVMAFDIRRAFTASGGGSRNQGGQTKRLVKYSLYSWGTPAVIVLICFVVDHIKDGSVGYGRGEEECFISTPQALLYCFVLPVGILMLFNLLALGHTLFNIIKTRKIARQVANQRPGSSTTLICIKMISVMGVTWLLGVAANFKVLWFLWYPFVVLNSLQGFFIFLSFAVSGRATELYKSRLSTFMSTRREGSVSTTNVPST